MRTIYKVAALSALMLTVSSTVMAAGMGKGTGTGMTAGSTLTGTMGTTSMGTGPGNMGSGAGTGMTTASTMTGNMGTTSMGTGPGYMGSGTGTGMTDASAMTGTMGTTSTNVAFGFVSGWNLAGNGIEAPIEVADTFNDTTKVATVWKWVTSGSSADITYPTWAFYAPYQSDSGQAYAASKGFALLTTINAGEGFWLNAKKPFSVPLPAGEAVQSNSFEASAGSHALPSGWNLIAIGDHQTPAGFNYQLSTTPPAAGMQPANVTTIWGWNATLSKWYFWSPSMVDDDTLASYIESKNYLDFATMPTSQTGGSMTPSMGFWVDMP